MDSFSTAYLCHPRQASMKATTLSCEAVKVYGEWRWAFFATLTRKPGFHAPKPLLADASFLDVVSWSARHCTIHPGRLALLLEPFCIHQLLLWWISFEKLPPPCYAVFFPYRVYYYRIPLFALTWRYGYHVLCLFFLCVSVDWELFSVLTTFGSISTSVAFRFLPRRALRLVGSVASTSILLFIASFPSFSLTAFRGSFAFFRCTSALPSSSLARTSCSLPFVLAWTDLVWT